jgi:hypothetical protein
MPTPNFPSFGVSDAHFDAGDDLMVSQWIDLRRSTAEAMPEKRLALAVLEDALRCARRTGMGVACVRSRAEALEWLLAEDTSAPFSFEGVCEALNINSGYLRAGLAAWFKSRQPLARRLPVITHHAKPLAERYERRRA